jgi:hypothetical protein
MFEELIYEIGVPRSQFGDYRCRRVTLNSRSEPAAIFRDCVRSRGAVMENRLASLQSAAVHAKEPSGARSFVRLIDVLAKDDAAANSRPPPDPVPLEPLAPRHRMVVPNDGR